METYANPEQGVKKMNSKTKGDLSEARALFEFQKYGIPVLIP